MQKEDVAYQSICRKLEQHEQTITQLLAIVASTNSKMIDLNQRQLSLEHYAHYFLRSPHAKLAKK